MDTVIYIFVFCVLAKGYLILWKRKQMMKLGYQYPFFNSSFKMLADFSSRVGFDEELGSRYNIQKRIVLGILVIISTVLIIVKFK